MPDKGAPPPNWKEEEEDSVWGSNDIKELRKPINKLEVNTEVFCICVSRDVFVMIDGCTKCPMINNKLIQLFEHYFP